MANKITNTQYYQAIADALRAKYEDNLLTFTPAQMAAAITNLPTGGDLDGYIDGSLTEIETNATSIKNSAFRNETTLLSVKAPLALSVGDAAFAQPTNGGGIQQATLPSATLLGKQAFSYCTNLTAVILPHTVDLSATDIFAGCCMLTLSEIPVSRVIGANCFNGCSILSNNALPAGIEAINDSAFASCTRLALRTLPSTLRTLGQRAFYGCQAITISDIPATVTSIGQDAFQQCTGLGDIKIRANSIGNAAFDGCTGITKAWLSSDVTTISANYYAYAPFYNCTNLTDIYCEASSKPSGWGTYFNYKSYSAQATVHYGVSEADFDDIIAA